MPQAIEDVGVEQHLVGLVLGLRVRQELLQQLAYTAGELSDIISETMEPSCHQEVLWHVRLGRQLRQDLRHLHFKLSIPYGEASEAHRGKAGRQAAAALLPHG